MTGQIIEAIGIALNAEFGDGYRIYPELTEQELERPCFFVYSLEASCNVYRGRRYLSKNLFIVQYFPSGTQIEAECNAVAQRLFGCLEFITFVGEDAPIMGTKMVAKVEDGRLFFRVNYDLFLLQEEEIEPMEELTQKTELKWDIKS